MSKVSLVSTKKSYEGTLAALEPLKSDLSKKLKNLKKLVIKINFVTAERELATTPLDSVRAFIDFVKSFYKEKIIIAEEATIGDTDEGFERWGFKKLSDDDPQVEVFNSAKSESKKVEVRHKGGKIKFSLAKIYTDSPFVVSITRAKTHDAVVATLSIKNLIVGSIQQKPDVRRSAIHQGKNIHKIMTEIAKHTFPDFAIVDGVVGMQGNGPIRGEPINSGWAMAGFDALAVDSLSAYLMGFDVDDIGYLNLMRDAKLGKLYPKDEIEIVGESADNLVKQFNPHATFESQKDWK